MNSPELTRRESLLWSAALPSDDQTNRERPRLFEYEFWGFTQANDRQKERSFFRLLPLMPGRLAVVVGTSSSAAGDRITVMRELEDALTQGMDVAEAMNRANRNHSDHLNFVTIFLGVIETDWHTITCVNAGHLPPLVRRKSSLVESLFHDDITDIPIGAVSDYTYHKMTVDLKPGDFVAVFNDGIVQCMGANGELLGLHRLKQFMAAECSTASEVGRNIIDGVKRFAGGTLQHDDECLLCFGRRPFDPKQL